MIRRAIITIAIILIPSAALADDAATLGPSTTGTSGGTSDPGTSAILQPAGTSTLQSGSDQSSSGLGQAPTDSNLQPAGTSDANKDLLVTEGSGDQHTLSDSADSISWPLFAGLGAAFVLIMVTMLFLENRRLRSLTATTLDDTPEPEVAAGTENDKSDDADKAEKDETEIETDSVGDEHKPDDKASNTEQSA